MKEIERKFILKKLPIFKSGIEIQELLQYYYKKEGDSNWYRIRRIQSSIDNFSQNTFLHTLKTYKDGICHEDEEFYDNETYNDLMKLILNSEIQLNIDSSERTRFLSKTRYVYKTNTKANFEGEERYIKWEIDSFNFPLIIAEIEIPDMDYKFEIPDFISDNILYEVTGIKEFSNRNLSEIVYKYKE